MGKRLTHLTLDHLLSICNALHDRDTSKQNTIPFSAEVSREGSGAIPQYR